jgi:hypothetical protein
LSKVTAVCTTCGTLYESSEVKHEKHRQNALVKARALAARHTDEQPHEVMVDPGSAVMEDPMVGKCPHGNPAARGCESCIEAIFARIPRD